MRGPINWQEKGALAMLYQQIISLRINHHTKQLRPDVCIDIEWSD
jgi:hypothetical protein